MIRNIVLILASFFCIIYLVNYSISTGKLDEFIDTHPEYTWGPGVEYYIGFFQDFFGNADKSIERFRRVVQKYPGTKYGPAAQYKIATIFDNRGNNRLTIEEYQKLLDLFPDSPYAEDAKKRIAYLR